MGVINLGWLIKKLKNTGFLTSTDYASTTKGGVIKVSNVAGTAINNGVLTAANRNLSEYKSAGPTLNIGKGTLENVKGELVTSVLSGIADTAGTAAVGTKWDTLVLEKTADGYTLSFKNTTTP